MYALPNHNSLIIEVGVWNILIVKDGGFLDCVYQHAISRLYDFGMMLACQERPVGDCLVDC